MILALYILLALIAVGSVLYLLHRRDMARNPRDAEATETAPTDSGDEACCGMHVTCEKDSLLSSVSTTVEYYDDEELDRYRGRGADDYTEPEIEEFRNVLLTLLPTDIAGWARSITLRGITLPQPVRDELLMIVAEARASRQVQPSLSNP